MLADSMVNLQKMRGAGIKANFVLLRSPALSEMDSVIKNADISMNTEFSVINTVNKIILMIKWEI
jgi:predicted amino acid racemase